MISNDLKREVKVVAIGTAILCLIMYGVFAAFGYYGLDVALGTLVGYLLCTGNFLLLALSVQKAVDSEDPNAAKKYMGISQAVRFALIFAVGLIGFKLPIFNGYAVLIPLVFTRLVIMFTGTKGRK